MKIVEDFIRGNNRISIISNQGLPTVLSVGWRPIFDSCDMLVAIPDMHMYIHRSNLDNFKYGAQAMLHFLRHLGRLKRKLARKGKTLRIYQLGDLYELRFPSAANPSSNVMPSEITLSNPKYNKILNVLDSLRTHYLYGNHDFELRHYAGFRFGAIEGKVYLEHGFAADNWSDFSNPGKFLWEPGQFIFKKLREIESFFAKLLVAISVIKQDEHFAVGVPDGSVERSHLPSPNGYPKQQKTYYEKRLEQSPDQRNIRVCIIGHTHYPYLNPNVENGKRIFVDAGAWTSGRSDFVVITNEELAICRYKR